MIIKRLTRVAVLAVIAALAACSTPKPLIDADPSLSHEQQLLRDGRFALLVFDRALERNTDSVQGNFRWLSQQERITLDLSSPLGQVLARVEVRPGHASMTRANGEYLEASNPDELVTYVLGNPIPVSGLQYWIHGRAMPTYSIERAEYDEAKRLTRFQQAGWQVTLSDYDAQGPKRLALIRQVSNQRINVRISID